MAELKGPANEVESGVRALAGVEQMELSSNNGWVRVSVLSKSSHDVREDLFRLTSSKGWGLRELHREGASLEYFFIKVIAEQQPKK